MVTYEAVKSAATSLPLRDREKLIDDLHDSLGGNDPEKIRESWMVEIRRRIAEVESGEAVMVDGEEALAQLRKEFSKSP